MRLASHANATHASQNETQNRKQNPKPMIWTSCWRYFVEGVGVSGGPQDDFAGIRQQGINHSYVKTQVTAEVMHMLRTRGKGAVQKAKEH